MSDQHEYVTGPDLPAAMGPYSATVTLGNLVIVSGQGAVDPAVIGDQHPPQRQNNFCQGGEISGRFAFAPSRLAV